MTPAAQARLQRAAALVAVLFVVCAGVLLYRPGGEDREWVRIQRAYFAARSESAAPRVRERSVAWACARAADGECSPITIVERCTTCHLGADEQAAGDSSRLPGAARAHPDRARWLGAHPAATFGCSACHGGDAVSLDRETAHRGLARLGRAPGEVPEIEARCAACHTGPLQPASASPARAAWASFRAAVHREVAASPRSPGRAPWSVEPAPSLAAGRSLFRSLRCGVCHASSEPAAPATPLGILAVRSSQLELAASFRAHAELARVELPADEPSVSSLAAHLMESAQPDAATAVLHRASLAGSSAEEGRVLFERMACKACHDASMKAPLDLENLKATRTADWVAYYLGDPARANPAAKMPSMRLAAREAASLATYLLAGAREAPLHPIDRSPVPCPLPDGPVPMPRSACGQALARAMQCASCHASTPGDPPGPSLRAYGDSHDGPAALAGLDAHGPNAAAGKLRFSLSDEERRSLATFLVSGRSVEVLSNFVPRGELWEGARGAELYDQLRCGGCHSDDPKDDARGPSLFGEGLRTRPQWLFGLLRDPAHHAVLPAFHPEWAYRDLVPPEHAAPRMPSYQLSEDDATALVRFFTARDGASYPYANTASPVLPSDALASAIGDYTHKDRGGCATCHTVAAPDVDRARAEGDKLAAPLSLAHTRLRPEWIEACILQPGVWVGPKMPSLFRDPFGPPLPWPQGAASEPPRRALDQVDRLRDLVLLLRERTVLPPAGAEGLSPAFGLGDL